MKRRTCPNCNEKLGEYDYYFCSACGEQLPEELALKPKSIRIKTYKLEDAVKKAIPFVNVEKLKNPKLLISTALVIFIGIVLFGIYSTGVTELFFIQKSRDVTTVEIPQKQVDTSNVITSETDFATGDFSKSDLASYFPAETLLYFEAFDLENFSKYYTENENLSELFSRSDILFENNFAGGYLVLEAQDQQEETLDEAESEFKEEDEKITQEDKTQETQPEVQIPEPWVFVFKLKDAGLVEKILEDIKAENWQFQIVENTLIMAQNENAFSTVEQVRGKVSQSLAQDSEYVQKTKDLPNIGAIKLVFMDEELKEKISEYFEYLNPDISGVLTKVLNSTQTGLLVE